MTICFLWEDLKAHSRINFAKRVISNVNHTPFSLREDKLTKAP